MECKSKLNSGEIPSKVANFDFKASQRSSCYHKNMHEFLTSAVNPVFSLSMFGCPGRASIYIYCLGDLHSRTFHTDPWALVSRTNTASKKTHGVDVCSSRF